MRIGIVVDSACDLPAEFIREHGIQVLPITVRIGDRLHKDERDAEATHRFFETELDGHKSDYAESIPTPGEELRDLILSRMQYDYDHIYVLTVSSTRSQIYRNALQATGAIAQAAVSTRYARGMKDLLRVEVVDSKTMFPGQGVQVVKLVELIRTLRNPPEISAALQDTVRKTAAFMIPNDLKYLYTRAKQKNDNSVSFLSFTLGSLLDIKPIIRCKLGETETFAKVRSREAALEKISEILLGAVEGDTIEPVLNVSYGGPVSDLGTLPLYGKLKARLADKGLRVLESHMSLTAGINVGRGALAFAVLQR